MRTQVAVIRAASYRNAVLSGDAVGAAVGSVLTACNWIAARIPLARDRRAEVRCVRATAAHTRVVRAFIAVIARGPVRAADAAGTKRKMPTARVDAGFHRAENRRGFFAIGGELTSGDGSARTVRVADLAGTRVAVIRAAER